MEIQIRASSPGIRWDKKTKIEHMLVVDGALLATFMCAEIDDVDGCLRSALKAFRKENEDRPRRRGRKLTTGRYDTREELVHAVWDYWLNGPHSQTAIARITRVSPGTVSKILDAPKPEGVPEPCPL